MRAWLWYIMPTPFAFWLAKKINSSRGKIGSNTVETCEIFRGNDKRKWFVSRQYFDKERGA